MLCSRTALGLVGLLAASAGCSGDLVGERSSADGSSGDAPATPGPVVDGPPTAIDGSPPPVPDGPPPADGTATDQQPPATDGGAPDQAPPFPLQNGQATYYDADGSGNCSFDPSPGDLMVAAMNQTDYQSSEACGACVEVIGPLATIVVRIVDRCPECGKGHIDLSQQAFAKIAPLPDGLVPISWRYVPCSVSGPVVYKFKEGSNQWWTAVQVRNSRYAIAALEAKPAGASYQTVPRENYNYFVAAGGLGPGPYTFRVTDVLGHVITDSNIAFAEGQQVPGTSQFPP